MVNFLKILLLVLGFSSLLVGCGLRGSLYMPKDSDVENTSTETNISDSNENLESK
ncbi:MAG: lipoprotein [Succinivibrionaceae bacterium]|nr:lipoprotein [Succinivibrionaceae bacterium]MEE1339612.1 lipoprotein [Succinivibrionaceae bacterium]